MEVRKDYFLDRWVYFSASRGARPKELKREVSQVALDCFFCPGNETKTPPEIGHVGEPWNLRWFENKFAAVTMDAKSKKMKNGILTSTPSYGKQEVIVETNRHDIQLWDFSADDIFKVLSTYKNRIMEIGKSKKIKYVLVFKNHGLEAGTSLIHSHSQVIATAVVPPLVLEESKKSKKVCIYCQIVKLEASSERKCFENDSFISFCPYASRFHYENWIVPKNHVKDFDSLSESQLKDLAQILKSVLGRLKELGIDYNMVVHYSPAKENLHFHVELTPRESIWAGFEIGSNFIINSVFPEEAAKFYRSEIAKDSK